jgi:glycine hydroxymethyltransferase
MGLDLLEGGHLTHGWKHSMTSKFWRSVPYHLTPDGAFDFDEIAELARKERPSIIWCGGTAVPRTIPFERFAAIADEIGALLVADISHIAGLIVGGEHPSPVPHAHLVTTTTHKTLRGPRGALILVTQKGLDRDPDLSKKIDKAIIPGLQGGPHLHTIAGIGVALGEAARPEFKTYAKKIIDNGHALADALLQHGFTLVSGGTDNHLILIDLRPTGIGRGKFFDLALERIGLYANRNTVPKDPSSAFYPSGLRIGTPAATTRGMGPEEMKKIASWIHQVSRLLENYSLPEDKIEREDIFKKLNAEFETNPAYEQL